MGSVTYDEIADEVAKAKTPVQHAKSGGYSAAVKKVGEISHVVNLSERGPVPGGRQGLAQGTDQGEQAASTSGSLQPGRANALWGRSKPNDGDCVERASSMLYPPQPHFQGDTPARPSARGHYLRAYHANVYPSLRRSYQGRHQKSS
mmetsp:Transcript_6312/g.23304  ORF Transcript_6312/g.23304 Transcript_6312/m.23304 type:complete len:147 (-) Transcript_6312:1078-1518(-)